MKARHGTEASGGGRSARATPIKLGFKPEEEEDLLNSKKNIKK